MSQSPAPEPVPLVAGMSTSGAEAGPAQDDENVCDTALDRLNQLFRKVDAQCPDDPLRRLITSYRESQAEPDR